MDQDRQEGGRNRRVPIHKQRGFHGRPRRKILIFRPVQTAPNKYPAIFLLYVCVLGISSVSLVKMRGKLSIHVAQECVTRASQIPLSVVADERSWTPSVHGAVITVTLKCVGQIRLPALVSWRSHTDTHSAAKQELWRKDNYDSQYPRIAEQGRSGRPPRPCPVVIRKVPVDASNLEIVVSVLGFKFADVVDSNAIEIYDVRHEMPAGTKD